jgi:hypothetical protein
MPATIRIIEKWAFYSCRSLTEVLSAEGSQVQVIEKEAFEHPWLKKLEIPGSLQYIGARMCPATTELLLTRESKIPMFENWKMLFLMNRNHEMGHEQDMKWKRKKREKMEKRVDLHQESVVQLCKEQDLFS